LGGGVSSGISRSAEETWKRVGGSLEWTDFIGLIKKLKRKKRLGGKNLGEGVFKVGEKTATASPKPI